MKEELEFDLYFGFIEEREELELTNTKFPPTEENTADCEEADTNNDNLEDK